MEDGSLYFIFTRNLSLTLTLSDEDNTSVLGDELTGKGNQKWIATEVGLGWTLKNVASGRFLGIADDPRPGVKVIAGDSPTVWMIIAGSQGPDVLSIVVPNTSLNVSLPNDYDVPTGTPVKLQDSPFQSWKFMKP